MAFEYVIYEKQGEIVTITMNMPQRLNPWNRGLMRDLVAAYREFWDDPELVVAILTGAGRGFNSGRDRKEDIEIMNLPEAEREAAQDEWKRLSIETLTKVMRRDGPKPVV